MTMGTQTDEVAIPGASLSETGSWMGHPTSVIRAPGALDSVLRGTPSTPSRDDSDDGALTSTSAPRPSPDASSSDAESVCVSSSQYRVPLVPLGASRTPLEDPVSGLLSPGFASPSDVLGVWTYPLCDPRFAVRLACEAPDSGSDRRLAMVPELYHGLLARSAGALHYGPAGAADAGRGLFGFPWAGPLTPGPHRPLASIPSSAPSKTPPSPTLKFGMDRILSGEVCSQEAKEKCSPGVGASCSRLDCGSQMSSLGHLSYAGLLAPTPLRIFSHATSSQLAGSRSSGPGAQSALTAGGGGGKRKRSWSRAVFSNLQRKGLEKRFQLQKYITKPDRRQLAATLGLTDAQVKVWFQNRRMKWRHTKESKPQQPGSTASQTRLIETDEKTRELSPTIS